MHQHARFCALSRKALLRSHVRIVRPSRCSSQGVDSSAVSGGRSVSTPPPPNAAPSMPQSGRWSPQPNPQAATPQAQPAGSSSKGDIFSDAPADNTTPVPHPASSPAGAISSTSPGFSGQSLGTQGGFSQQVQSAKQGGQAGGQARGDQGSSYGGYQDRGGYKQRGGYSQRGGRGQLQGQYLGQNQRYNQDGAGYEPSSRQGQYGQQGRGNGQRQYTQQVGGSRQYRQQQGGYGREQYGQQQGGYGKEQYGEQQYSEQQNGQPRYSQPQYGQQQYSQQAGAAGQAYQGTDAQAAGTSLSDPSTSPQAGLETQPALSPSQSETRDEGYGQATGYQSYTQQGARYGSTGGYYSNNRGRGRGGRNQVRGGNNTWGSSAIYNKSYDPDLDERQLGGYQSNRGREGYQSRGGRRGNQGRGQGSYNNRQNWGASSPAGALDTQTGRGSTYSRGGYNTKAGRGGRSTSRDDAFSMDDRDFSYDLSFDDDDLFDMGLDSMKHLPGLTAGARSRGAAGVQEGLLDGDEAGRAALTGLQGRSAQQASTSNTALPGSRSPASNQPSPSRAGRGAGGINDLDYDYVYDYDDLYDLEKDMLDDFNFGDWDTDDLDFDKLGQDQKAEGGELFDEDVLRDWSAQVGTEQLDEGDEDLLSMDTPAASSQSSIRFPATGARESVSPPDLPSELEFNEDKLGIKHDPNIVEERLKVMRSEVPAADVEPASSQQQQRSAQQQPQLARQQQAASLVLGDDAPNTIIPTASAVPSASTHTTAAVSSASTHTTAAATATTADAIALPSSHPVGLRSTAQEATDTPLASSLTPVPTKTKARATRTRTRKASSAKEVGAAKSTSSAYSTRDADAVPSKKTRTRKATASSTGAVSPEETSSRVDVRPSGVLSSGGVAGLSTVSASSATDEQGAKAAGQKARSRSTSVKMEGSGTESGGEEEVASVGVTKTRGRTSKKAAAASSRDAGSASESDGAAPPPTPKRRSPRKTKAGQAAESNGAVAAGVADGAATNGAVEKKTRRTTRKTVKAAAPTEA